eukprot:1190368-Heterocapsa_arctica.AAC.1
MLGIIPYFEVPARLVSGEKVMPLITAGPLYDLPVHVPCAKTMNQRHDEVDCSVDALEQFAE